MFSGIVEALGTVRSVAPGRIDIATDLGAELRPGDSVAVNGACLTVAERDAGGFAADVMPETLHRTSLGDASPGATVNLERCLALGDRLGGHLVTGHVDATGVITAMRRDGNATWVTVGAPDALMPLIAEKGSIAVDGISLTVVDVYDSAFSVSLIPHTLQHTTAAHWQPGAAVNLEADVLARYVQRALRAAAPQPVSAGGGR